MNATPPFALLEAVLPCFKDIQADGYAIDEMIAACRTAPDLQSEAGLTRGHVPTHHGLLGDAIDAIDAPHLQTLKFALRSAKDHLQ